MQKKILMLKKIKYFIIIILGLSVAILAYYISLDSKYTVQRERLIKAPANLVYQQIADLKNWPKWAPWKDKDSLMRFEFEQSTNKEGDYMRFIDNDGQPQKLTNITLKPDSLIVQSLSGGDQSQELEWHLKSTQNGVKVICKISGELQPIQRLFHPDMNQLIGPFLTRGLELMDRSVHKDMNKHEMHIMNTVDLSDTYYIYQSAACRLDSLMRQLDKALPAVIIYALKNQVETTGKPIVIYNKRDEQNNSVIFSAAVPTREKIIPSDSHILTGKLPGGLYLKIKYQGPYKYLPEAWKQTKSFINSNANLVEDTTREPFEEYAVGHTKSLNPADWITYLYIPVIEIKPKEIDIQ